jgi:hypothetical protein
MTGTADNQKERNKAITEGVNNQMKCQRTANGPVSDRQAMGCSRLDNQGVCGRSHRKIGFLASALTTSPDQDQGCK